MPRTIAQIIESARELGPQSLTPSEFRALKSLEKSRKANVATPVSTVPTEDEPDPGPGHKGWYTRQKMAEVFGFTTVQFDRAIRPDMERADIKKVENKLLFRARGAIDVYAHQYAQKVRPLLGDDDVYSSADSPSLERYRSIKADLAQLDLDERRGNLVVQQGLAGHLSG